MAVLGFNPDVVDTTLNATLGHRAKDEYGTEFIYLQANATIADSILVYWTDAFLAAGATTTAVASKPQGVAIACAAYTSGQFGWFACGFIHPSSGVTVSTAASITAGAAMTTTGTAGVIGAGGTAVKTLVTTTTTTGAAAVGCRSDGPLIVN